jgi:restriction endonuclease S subunit
VNDGDFLLSNSMSFGRPYIMRTNCCIHDGWLVLSKYEGSFEQDFLYHLLGSPQVFGQFDRLAAGSTVRNLNIDLASRVVVPIPPAGEQRRIVAILDETFEGIATAKANAEKNLQNASDLFDGYAKSVFLQGVERWPTPIAFSVSGCYWVNNHAHILKFDHMATQRFVEFFLESIPLDDYITGAAQPKLNQKALNSIPIPIPGSVDSQVQAVDRLERVAEQSELLQGVYERKLAALADLKKSLLHQAFTGAL